MVLPDKKRLFYLSLLTLLGMSAIGILLIIYAQKKDVNEVLLGGKNYGRQLLSGLVFGGLASALAVVLLNGSLFKGVRAFFTNLIQEIQPSFLNIVFYSFLRRGGGGNFVQGRNPTFYWHLAGLVIICFFARLYYPLQY